MAYQLKYSPDAELAVDNILDYFYYRVDGVGNPRIAEKWFTEFEKVLKSIADRPNSFALCDNPRYCELGIRKAHLRHYKYKILYRISNNGAVVIDAVCHDKQDYEKLL